MNRRSFLETLAKTAAGFTILTSATTYARTWKRSRHLWVIEWEDVYVGVGSLFMMKSVIKTINHIDEETWLRLANPVLS